MPLSEHVYCVNIPYKMTKQVEQRICVKFCVRMEHSSTETIWVIQKTAAMGSWWLAASSQCSCSSHLMQSFLLKYQITQVTQPPYSSDLVPCNFWLSSKLKSPLKGQRYQTINEFQGSMMGQLMTIGRTVWGPKVPTLKWIEVSLPNVSCILYLLQ